MFKRLSISQGIVSAMMIVVSLSLLLANVIHFVLFNEATAEVIRTSSREINKQVIMNYERYIDEVIETANYLTRKTIELTEDGELDQLQSLFFQATQMSQDMVSIVLYSSQGEPFIIGDEKSTTVVVANASWFLAATRDKEIFHFSSPHPQALFSGVHLEVITVTKSIRYYVGNTITDGVLMIDLTTQNFRGLAQKTNLGENGLLLILDDTSGFVYSSTDQCIAAVCPAKELVDQIIFGGESVQVDKDFMYLNVNTLKHTRWRIATFININQIYTTRKTMNILASVIFVGALLLSLGFSVILSKQISDPLNKLKNHMAHIEGGNMMSEVHVVGQKEVVLLSKNFNHMIAEIRQLLDRLVQEQKEKRKSEFLALQTQINPHFLYNTLDSIVWLAENNQNKEVVEMVIALSRFFRISISRGKNVISVKDELEHAKQYLHIQKIRYNKKFDYEFIVQPNVYQFSVVKLILQPIIENAIHHGIHSEFESGKIRISAYTTGKKLIFEVENNGYGITPERIQELMQNMRSEEQANSVGLRNVYQRLQLYYGEEADVQIISEQDQMTNVKLIVPCRKDYADEKNN
ncbi:MAG: sensor histidine kinase [bacterium]|nr:sensor histidine kinase [bacterium]